MLAVFGAGRHDQPVRRLTLVVSALLLSACAPGDGHFLDRGAARLFAVRSEVDATPPKAPLPPLSIEREPSAGDASAAELAPADDAVAIGLRSAVVQTGAKSVGSTSVVLKVPLDGGLYGAFKPETRKHGDRWRAEVAAYRLSRALGIDNVPVSVPRPTKLSALEASSKSASMRRILREQVIAGDDGRVRGAMIAWVHGLSRLPLENDPLFTAFGEWLSQTPPKKLLELRVGKTARKRVHDAAPLAPQISTLIAFDHLTGNRDRWSGHNVLVDVTGTRLVFLDNNLAFDAALDVAATKKRAFMLNRVQRFSRSFLQKARALGREQLVMALGRDDRDEPLLTDAQIDAVFARRDELVAWVDELIAKYGEDRVLCFD